MRLLTEDEVNLSSRLDDLNRTVELIENIRMIFEITFDQACKIYEIMLLESIRSKQKEGE